jgi:hypothetical protein
MYKYKYTGTGSRKFRASLSNKDLHIKKVYEVNEGENIELPVKVDVDWLKLEGESKEVKKSKSKESE